MKTAGLLTVLAISGSFLGALLSSLRLTRERRSLSRLRLRLRSTRITTRNQHRPDRDVAPEAQGRPNRADEVVTIHDVAGVVDKDQVVVHLGVREIWLRPTARTTLVLGVGGAPVSVRSSVSKIARGSQAVIRSDASRGVEVRRGHI